MGVSKREIGASIEGGCLKDGLGVLQKERRVWGVKGCF
jgi:hypothetical protein